jgi:serine/threonine-protein kinase SRPK3
MEGVDLQSVLNKGKQMATNVAASATNGTTNKKRRKGTDLKPIVTNDSATAAGEQPGSTTEGYVLPDRFFFSRFPCSSAVFRFVPVANPHSSRR